MHLSKKDITINDNPFITKVLRKAIMHSSKLKNNSHKARAREDWNKYKSPV